MEMPDEIVVPPSELEKLRERAYAGLERNCVPVFGSGGKRVLTEGGIYTGIWLECGPHESLTLAPFLPEVALMSHRIFYLHQREDGQFPAYILGDRAGYSQIQQVVPIAATAWELARMTGSGSFLQESYEACSRWEKWLVRHRDPRGLDLLEAWCEYDTGHDNSPRWKSVPKLCPREEARNCPDGVMPRFAPDLSATLYGMRIALAEMADALGRKEEQAEYCAAAERTRRNIGKYCFDPEREFYFDRIPGSGFCGIVGDAGLRVLGEHVPSQVVADRIFRRYILNPEAFWTPYPLPSIAANDPEFMYPPCLNCWGGASQALAALRTLRYFEFYGYGKELRILMTRWLEAILRTSGFQQQMDPFTGEFSTSPGYSPCMCVALEFGARLSEPEGLSMGAFVHDVAELLG